jgi:hypothetical protein
MGAESNPIGGYDCEIEQLLFYDSVAFEAPGGCLDGMA